MGKDFVHPLLSDPHHEKSECLEAYELNAIFIFGNCEKKRYCGNTYLPCVFINIIYQMYSYCLLWKAESGLEKLKGHGT